MTAKVVQHPSADGNHRRKEQFFAILSAIRTIARQDVYRAEEAAARLRDTGVISHEEFGLILAHVAPFRDRRGFARGKPVMEGGVLRWVRIRGKMYRVLNGFDGDDYGI